jgi:hypothetical protein
VKARSDAWQVAEAYGVLQSDEERVGFIKERDAHVAQIGNAILKPPLLLRVMAGQLRFFEQGSIADKVRVLNRI